MKIAILVFLSLFLTSSSGEFFFTEDEMESAIDKYYLLSHGLLDIKNLDSTFDLKILSVDEIKNKKKEIIEYFESIDQVDSLAIEMINCPKNNVFKSNKCSLFTYSIAGRWGTYEDYNGGMYFVENGSAYQFELYIYNLNGKIYKMDAKNYNEVVCDIYKNEIVEFANCNQAFEFSKLVLHEKCIGELLLDSSQKIFTEHPKLRLELPQIIEKDNQIIVKLSSHSFHNHLITSYEFNYFSNGVMEFTKTHNSYDPTEF
jgi:hypothetical protein